MISVYNLILMELRAIDIPIRTNYLTYSVLFRRKIKRLGLTRRDVITWLSYRTGFSNKELSVLLRVTPQRISQRIKKVDTALKQHRSTLHLRIPRLENMGKLQRNKKIRTKF